MAWEYSFLGYARAVFAIASLYYVPYHPRTFSLLYSVSCLLDALDCRCYGNGSVSMALTTLGHCRHQPWHGTVDFIGTLKRLHHLLSLFMLFKEYVNGIQLVETSRWLAQGDVKMRTDARLLREKIDDLTNVRSWETNFILNVTNMLFS
jgi:hypothetical protein